MEELYGERKRLERIAAAEAAGDSFFTLEFDDAVRAKLEYAITDIGSAQIIMSEAHKLSLRSLGVRYLHSDRYQPFDDFKIALSNAYSELIPTLLEALYKAYVYLEEVGYWGDRLGRAGIFEDRTNEVFLAHRVSFEMVNGFMVERESQELHAAVVSPVLRLLSGRNGWEHIEVSYQKALREISEGHPDDAITDAATALQDALTLLGCDGNALGPLISDAKKRNLIAAHDAPVLHWVSADRSETGDGHHKSDASIEDAWLTVHVVGALILRLATGGPRVS